MGGDLSGIARRSETVAELLDTGRRVWLTCPRGSEMSFEITDRTATADDGDLGRHGAFGNLPCGEAFIAPRSGHGELVVTSIASLD
jgi:leucyl aminopeptidase (aminopeptidase T)